MTENIRSQLLKLRHKRARRELNIFREKYGDKEIKYSDFLRNKNPLRKRIIAYNVSYQLSYRGETDAIIIQPKTFTVYGFYGQESEIRKKTMNMVVDARGRNTKASFNRGTMEVIENDLKVDILPRGMEETTAQVNRDIENQVVNKNFVVKELDNSIEFTNKKGRKGQMDLDIRHFL